MQQSNIFWGGEMRPAYVFGKVHAYTFIYYNFNFTATTTTQIKTIFPISLFTS